MKQKLFFTIAVMALIIAVPGGVVVAQDQAPEVPAVGKVGVLLQDGHRGELTYVIGTTIPTQSWPVVGWIMKEGHVAGIYSDRPLNEAQGPEADLIGTQLMSERQFHFGSGIFVGVGGGWWHIFDDDASDANYVAYRGQVGWATGLAGRTLEIYLGADGTLQSGPNMYYPHISLSLF